MTITKLMMIQSEKQKVFLFMLSKKKLLFCLFIYLFIS